MSEEPVYKQIERHLLERLASGEGYTAPLPGEAALAESFNVSRMTVRQAYGGLVNAGLVTRTRSKGTYARIHLSDDLGAMTTVDFLDRWHDQGYEIVMELLQYGTRPATEAVAASFKLPKKTELTYVERLRSANGLPVALDVRWMPPEVFNKVESKSLEHASIFTVLDRCGFVLDLMDFELSARMGTPTEVSLLRSAPKDPLIERKVWCTTVGLDTVLVGHSLYPSDRVSYRGHLRFDGHSADEGHPERTQ
jgi:GntR family transcriptional regulator